MQSLITKILNWCSDEASAGRVTDASLAASGTATSALVPTSHYPSTPTICQRCRSLQLRASDFYLPAGAAAKGDTQDIRHPIELETRPWSYIEAQINCSLCRLIAFAVKASARKWQAGETPHTCKIRTARMNLRNESNSKSQASDSNRFDLRTLDIIAEYQWTHSDDISLLPVRSSESPHPFLGRIIDTEYIDSQQISGWLRVCQEEHNELCHVSKTQEFEKLRSRLRVIDVHEWCLTTMPDDSRYLALSYIWGGVDQPQTKLGNIEELSIPGGLKKLDKIIPKTIADAMTCVKLLGERYLWVDALCIVQDDDVSRQFMIDRMHIIYQQAHLTIFAATGLDANAGLPGVSSPREVSQHVASIYDGLKFMFPMHYLALKDSRWASRGWTYQEYFFSKRRLIFFGGQVVYQCNNIRWREDIMQEQLKKGITFYQINIGGDRMSWEPPGVHTSSDKWDRNRYVEYVETYIDRGLSKDDDVLNAFAGIMADASKRGLDTFYGLTKSYFALDLLWLPCRWLSRRSGFPSWSWGGWQGPIIMEKLWPDYASAQIWTHRMSWIQFYAYDEADQIFRIFASGYSPQREREIQQEESKHKAYQEMRRLDDNPNAEEGDEKQTFFEGWSGETNIGKVLTPLLARLSSSAETDSRKLPSFVGPGSLGFDQATLLFRTMTATLSISALKPNGQRPYAPRRLEPLLPSAPSLYLYTKDNIHIGTAWTYSKDTFNRIVSSSSLQATNVLKVEVAIIGGPVRADWRTRNESPSEYEIMQELVLTGGNSRDVVARHTMLANYHGEIGKIFLDMLKDRYPDTYQVLPIEALGLDDELWDSLEARARLLNFPGHTKETFNAYRAQVMNTNSCMRVDHKVRYFRVLLIGVLDGEMLSGTGRVAEVFGKGEIREDRLGSVDGLDFRDVLLR